MSEWIGVQDRLPPTGHTVLAYTSDDQWLYEGPFFLVKRLGNTWEWVNDTYPNSCNQTGFIPEYWMPLPEEPQ